MIHVGHDVGDTCDLAFDGAGAVFRRRADRHAVLALRVPGDAVTHFPCQVQAFAIVLEHVDNAQALLVVIEAARHQLAQDTLTGMAERRVAKIVAERDRLGELLVQVQHLGDRSRDLRNFQRVRQAGAVVIAGRRKEHLRLVLEAAKRLGVDDAVAVALESRPNRIFVFLAHAALAVGAFRSLRREDLPLTLFEMFANRRAHAPSIIPRSR